MPNPTCAHIRAIKTVKRAKRTECEECVKVEGSLGASANLSGVRHHALLR